MIVLTIFTWQTGSLPLFTNPLHGGVGQSVVSLSSVSSPAGHTGEGHKVVQGRTQAARSRVQVLCSWKAQIIKYVFITIMY